MGMSKTSSRKEVGKWTFHQNSKVSALINKSLEGSLTKTISPSSGVIEALLDHVLRLGHLSILRSIASLSEATRFISANMGNFFGTVSTSMGSPCVGLLGIAWPCWAREQVAREDLGFL